MEPTIHPTTPGIVHLPGAGKSMTVASLRITQKVTGAETAGAWALLEYSVPARFVGSPLHWHQTYSESFYILSGTVTLQIAEQVIQAIPGSFALAAPGAVHRFWNAEDIPATFLSFVAPSGLECFLAELATLMQNEPTWPPADMSQITALNAHYGIYPGGQQRP